MPPTCFWGGQYTAPFWIFVVIIGMALPAILEFLEIRKISHTGCDSGGAGAFRQPDVAVCNCLCRAGKPVALLIYCLKF
jgi:formate-dependent nitrite reductase membrane component NrfD